MTDVLPRMRRTADLRAAFVAVLVTLVAWQILSRATVSLLLADDQPETALALRPSNGDALRDAASIVIAHPHGKTATANAVTQLTDRALIANPLDPVTLRLMAQSAEMAGNAARAEALMRVAGDQTIRNDVVDLYLLNQDAAQKKYAQALPRADALLRVSPALSDNVLAILDYLATQPGAHPALIDTLGAGPPPWRATYLASLASKIADPTAFLDVLLALKTAPAPLTDADLRAFLDPLVNRALVEQAYYIWLQFLPPKRLDALTYLANGNFEYPLTNLPFDWTILPIEGATASFEQIPDRDGRGLNVVFDGRRVAFRNVVQLLLLPPGKYKFSGSYLVNGLNNPRGMTWRLYCAQRNDSVPIAQTERVSGTSGGWKDFETLFDVPAETCGAQWLRLELASRVASEEEGSGSIWYTGLKIDKADGSAAKPTLPTIAMPAQPGSQFERALRGRD